MHLGKVVMISTVTAIAAWAVTAAAFGPDGASLADQSKAQPTGEIEMTVEPSAPNVDTSGVANSENNAKADASASASANVSAKSSGQGGCQARSSATASATANGQSDYDHDEDFESSEGDGCSAKARSSATATTRSD